MDLGFGNRSVGATLMNADSSRSHSIFTIHMERCDQDDKGEEHIRAGKLNLVDLAGSERQAKTGMFSQSSWSHSTQSISSVVKNFGTPNTVFSPFWG